MSGSPTLFVNADVSKRAASLICTGVGEKVTQGVELLLKNDLPAAGPGISDAGSLLQRGLGLLASSPYEALGISVGCGTIDVRKAYKRMALKYHPDKNPKTTPLFHAMKTASDKLTDAPGRRAEAAKAANQKATPAPPAAKPAATPAPPAANQKATPAPPAAKPAATHRYPQQPPRPTPTPPEPSGGGRYYSAAERQPQGAQYKYKYSNYGEDDQSSYSKKAEPKPAHYYEQAQYQQYTSKNSSRDKKPDKQGRSAPRRPAPYEQQPPSQPGPYSFNDAQARARNRERVRAEAKRIEEEEREANKIRFREQQLREELRKEKERADFIRKERLENDLRKKRLQEEREAAQKAYKDRLRQEEVLRKQRAEDEERRRVVEQALEKQRMMEEKARRKTESYETTATPDERVRKWGARHYSNIPIRKEGDSDINSRARRPNTFTVNSTGDVRSTPQHGEAGNSSPVRTPPTPSALRCIMHDSTSAELAWSVPQYPFSPQKSALLTELSWKNASIERSIWEFSPQLLSASQVRKKNLLPGNVYEFKVRLVFLPRGRAVLTDRVVGPWSKAIVVMMSGPTDRTARAKETVNNTRAAGKKPSPLNDDDHDALTGQKLSESVRRAWYNDTEKESKCDAALDAAPQVEEEEEFYPRRAPSFRLGRTMFGKCKSRDPSPEPAEVDSDSGDDGKYIAKKTTPTSSATKPKRESQRGDFEDLFCNPGSTIEEVSEDEEVLDETEASCDDRPVDRTTDEVEEKDASEFVDDGHEQEAEIGENEDFFAGPTHESWPDVDVIHECVDEGGHIYYYNENTKQSEWTAPEWVEETDEQSGARYYVHLNKNDANPLASTWSKPQSFAKIVRNRRTQY